MHIDNHGVSLTLWAESIVAASYLQSITSKCYTEADSVGACFWQQARCVAPTCIKGHCLCICPSTTAWEVERLQREKFHRTQLEATGIG
jgi:hypothetical protein